MESLQSRYASSLLSLAIEEKKVKEYLEEVTKVKEILGENKDLVHLLSSYFLSREELNSTIDKVFSFIKNEYVKDFIKVVCTSRRGYMIESILREFIKEASLLENIVEGTVYSTSPLTKEEIKSLEVALEKKDGYKTKLINKIDPSLIGGIKIVINDKIIDRSMKSALDDIKKKILEGENS